MLILSRKLNESVVIDGRITVKVVRIDGDVVKLGISAPPEVPVHRQEVYDEIQRNNREIALANARTAKTSVTAAPVVACTISTGQGSEGSRPMSTVRAVVDRIFFAPGDAPLCRR